MSLDRFRTHKASPDYTYMSLAFILVLFGLVMISSSSVVLSVEIFNRNYGFVTRQATYAIVGIIAALILSKIDYRIWRKYAAPFLMISFMLLLIVFIPGVGKAAKGAARWIDFGVFQLQPSELLKLSYILYFAAWFESKGKMLKSFQNGFLPFVTLIIPSVLLLIMQRDLGTLLVVLAATGLMFYIAGASYSHLGIAVLAGVLMVALLIAIAPYRLQRFATFLDPSADKLGAGYHINQSLLAIGSGGMLGRGFGQSLQKYLYLPEPHTDSIFAITVEELGFLRSILVLLFIGLFAYRGYQIAYRAGDDFGRMLAFGVTSWLLVQSFINIAAIMGLVPLTGVPLPLISYGGTSLIASLIAIGIVVNVSRQSYGKN